jgi:cytochrome c nitrite reductase small subunit
MIIRFSHVAVAAAIAIGLAFGLGAFTFGYARGYSYLSNDPSACANCHVMNEHFDAWNKSSHRAVATCNSCHTPHNLVGKYVTKARNGFWHSFYFTTGRYPDPLRITERNREIAEASCRDCHGAMVEAIDPRPRSAAAHPVPATTAPGTAEPSNCVRCHRYVGHYVR